VILCADDGATDDHEPIPLAPCGASDAFLSTEVARKRRDSSHARIATAMLQ
jgi:hypothetical protein